MITTQTAVIKSPNGAWLNIPPPIYHVYTSGNHGIVNAIPTSGISGTEVTLTNIPDTGYSFNSYSVIGATLKNDNQFNIVNSDVYVYGNFVDPNPLNLPPYTIRLLYKDGATPPFNYGTGVQISQSPNIWDLTHNRTNWMRLLYNHSDLLEVLGANTSNITNMSDMFYSCSSLTTVALFDTSNVTTMASMFEYCTSLPTVPLFNTSNVTDMQEMFSGCTSLTTVPLFNTSNVIIMVRMFQRTALTTVPLFNTSSVTDMFRMFDNCNSLITVPLFDTSSVTVMQDMFKNCSSLTTVPLFNTSSVIDTSDMFYYCTNVESGALALYNQMSSQTVPPANHESTFHRCGFNTTTGAAELAQIPSDWK